MVKKYGKMIAICSKMIIFAASNNKYRNYGTSINDREDGLTIETEF